VYSAPASSAYDSSGASPKPGHDVIIVDRNLYHRRDASAANGGQLSYAFVAPLASPALLR
jgi:hypothetical protein